MNSDIVENNYVPIKNLRSRYDKFVVGHYCVHVCDREPSRIPVKRITRILNKSRKIRCLLRSYIKREVPHSSQMHKYVSKNNNSFRTSIAHCKSTLKNDYLRWIVGNKRFEKSFKCKMKLAKNNFSPVGLIPDMAAWDLHTYKNDFTSGVYKDSNFILSRDIETNPGPIDILLRLSKHLIVKS